jgi:hypothetical protein
MNAQLNETVTMFHVINILISNESRDHQSSSRTLFDLRAGWKDQFAIRRTTPKWERSQELH